MHKSSAQGKTRRCTIFLISMQNRYMHVFHIMRFIFYLDFLDFLSFSPFFSLTLFYYCIYTIVIMLYLASQVKEDFLSSFIWNFSLHESHSELKTVLEFSWDRAILNSECDMYIMNHDVCLCVQKSIFNLLTWWSSFTQMTHIYTHTHDTKIKITQILVSFQARTQIACKICGTCCMRRWIQVRIVSE